MHFIHMKYNLKRAVAALGATMMMLQAPFGHLMAYAQVPEAEGAYETISANTAVSENDVQQTVYTGNLLLNYAYIEKAQLSQGEQQNVLISVGDTETVWESATLTLGQQESGREQVFDMTDCVENVLRFAIDTAAMENGIYCVEELSYSYEADGSLYQGTIDFSKVSGMENVSFGLGAEAPFSEDEFTEYDTEGKAVQESPLEVNVVSLTGEKENMEAALPVAEALEQAQEQAQAEVPAASPVLAENGAMTVRSENVAAERKIAGSVVVMLDPGHDDTHAGARANGLEEENLTLKVAQYCKQYLESNYTNVVVYMSRSGGACPYPGTESGDCNANRVDDAYKKGADVYVSLHFNTTTGSSTTANGSIVFYPNSNGNNQVGTEGATLASKIIEQLAKLGLKNNGIQIRNSENNTRYDDGGLADYYGVIKRSKGYGIPAVIVEHAFLNNAQDAAFLKDENNLKKLGTADALGIAQAYSLSTDEVEFDAEDLQITDIDAVNGTFRMKLVGASPVKRIANIKFKVYPTAAKDKEYTYMAELTDKATGTYSVTGNVGNHGKLEGKYKVIAYAYDAAGRKTQLRSTTFSIAKASVNTSGMSVTTSVKANEKTVVLKLKGNVQAAGVYFKVKSRQPGAKAKTYQASQLSNGQWRAVADISKHKDAGEYVVTAYSKDYYGTSVKVATGSFTITGPTAKSVAVTKLNLTKGTFRVVVRGVESKSGVKKVSLTVRTMDGKKIKKTYSPKKASSGYYYADINMKDYKYQYGRYNIDVTVKDGNGIEKVVKSYVKELKEPVPVLSANTRAKQTKILLKASNLGVAANVKAVRFRVISVEKPSAKKDYTVTKANNGVYQKTISVSDFGVSGNYKVFTYVKGADGKFRKVGKVQIVTVTDIAGGKTLLRKKSESAYNLYVSGIEYKGDIASVKVKAWPLTDKKAQYVYTASKNSKGTYRVTLDSKKHKGTGGEYKYQVIVTAKNGVKKTLLSGKVTIGESSVNSGELYAIAGTSEVTVTQMMTYYNKHATYPSFYMLSDAPTLKKFCQMYYDECKKEGIRAEVAFAQAMHETNFLRYGGDVQIQQYNFAGIGATGGGAQGNSFSSVRVGIRAQVQHLKAYASSDPLSQICVDPRFDRVQRGCAPYVEWLSIPANPNGKGWATNPLYGSSLRKMINELVSC